MRFQRTFERNGRRGSALIETTIAMPVYMILIFGVLYVGYLTLGMQEQHQAAQYMAMMRQEPSYDHVIETFFPWSGGMEVEVTAEHNAYVEDIFYQTDTHTVLPELTYPLHRLSNGAGQMYTFDQERIGVSLAVLAMPKITRTITLDTILGGETTDQISWTDYSRYLNTNYQGHRPLPGGGFVDTPATFDTLNLGWDPEVHADYVKQISRALTGVPQENTYGTDEDYAADATRWLDRCRVESSVTFDFPWAGRAAAAEDEPEPTFQEFVTGDYRQPEPLEAESLVYVTRRSENLRLTPTDPRIDRSNALQLMDDIGKVLNSAALGDPAGMEHDLENRLGEDVWRTPID